MRTLGFTLAASITAACASNPEPLTEPASSQSAPEPAPAAADAAAASAPSAGPSAAPDASALPTAPTSPAAGPPAALPAGLKVLVIGDSFAEALGVGLKAKEQESGIKVFLRGEKATFIPEWAGPNRGVAGMLQQLKPDVVVIALGGNELAMTTPEIRAPKVEKLASLMGTTPCVWVAPPLWGNKDNGLLGIIRDHSKPCRHFDSNTLAPDLPRGSDKIHPTSEGQKKWAGHLLDWLRTERDSAASAFALKARPATE